MRKISSLLALVGYISIVPVVLADDAPRLAIGKVVIVTPKQDQTLAWPYDLKQVNSLQFATDANSTYDRVPSLSYNGKTELSIMYFSDDAPGRTDRIDMALIQGNKEGENITSFRYVVVSCWDEPVEADDSAMLVSLPA